MTSQGSRGSWWGPGELDGGRDDYGGRIAAGDFAGGREAGDRGGGRWIDDKGGSDVSRDGRGFWWGPGELDGGRGGYRGRIAAGDFADGREVGDHGGWPWVNEQLTRPAPRIEERSRRTEFSEPPASTSYLEIQQSRASRMPEKGVRGTHIRKSRISPAGLLGVAWLSTGAGLCLDGLAVSLAWHSSALAQPLFWMAILLPFGVFATVLTAGHPTPRVRQLIVALVGLYPSVVYRMSSPFVLSGFDEHLHEQTLNNLLHGSGLFAPNPLLIVSPYYPGLELFTGTIIRLTDVPVIAAMSLVVFLCRLLLVLALYQGALTVTQSHRRASLMVILYAASAQFYFFNSQFAYQTISLTLGVGGLVLLYRAQLQEGSNRGQGLAVLANLALLGTVVTHHATSWIVLAFMTAWTIAARPGQRKILARTTAVMAIALVAWTALTAHELSAYMGPILSGILQSIGLGAHLFRDSAGTALPEWERISLILYAVLCTCAAVVSGWIVLRLSRRDRNRMLGLIGLLSIAYPITLAVHFEPTIAPYGDRASTFMFLPVALCCSIAIRRPKLRAHRTGNSTSARIALLAAAVTFTYVGGVILGSGPAWGYLPGPYLVSADSRTQDPETLAAVEWAASHLPPGSRIVADRVPADLLAGEARLWPISHPENGLDPATLYFSTAWNSSLASIVKGMDIQYIYVDNRLSESLPHDGYYIFRGETPAPAKISRHALTKFADAAGLRVVYHHGPVTIYDTFRLGISGKVSDSAGRHLTQLSGPISGALGVVTGALVALALALRKRARGRRIFIEIGLVGYGLGAIIATMLAGAVMFGLRIAPGPEFGLAVVAIVLFSTRNSWSYRIADAVRRAKVKQVLHPLILLGTLAVGAGVFVGLRADWVNEVSVVNHILRTAIGTHF
jgi:hypothetical protein